MRIFLLSIITTSLFACSSAKKTAEPVLPKSIDEAVASSYRTPENLQRDQYRHPVETLKFFGLQPNMTVVEISPGAGWYLEILAPLLSGGGGRYIGALPPSAGSEYMTKLNDKVHAWITQHPEVKAEITSMSGEVAPAGTADMVLTFRNVHNWMTQGTQQEVFNKFFAALKPGGVLGVVEHRASEKGKQDPKAKSGYVKESEVIRLATKAGFKLDAKSEINANPKDTKDHPEGVWTLPPVLRLKEVNREKYVAIGESDRMTLRFIKPAVQ